MGFGSTAKKIQAMADRAEDLYAQILEVREQINDLRETLERTDQRVDHVASQTEKQWAVLRALAEERGIDVDAVLTEAAIEDVDPPDESSNEADPDAE